jgi:triosephosphate isomerase
MNKLVVANWKMNGSLELVNEFAEALFADNCVLGLPYIFLSHFRTRNKKLKLAAQDCSIYAKFGAFTGEISATMLKELGVNFVILGHSERRSLSPIDSVDNVSRKLRNAITAGLQVILCIDDNYEQLIDLCTNELIINNAKQVILAYEPLSAIGTGIVPTTSYIETNVSQIKNEYPRTDVLYGGSVNSKNIELILNIPVVDGVLIGGASLKIEEMLHIVGMDAI